MDARLDSIRVLVSRLDEEWMTAACLDLLTGSVLSDYSGGSAPTEKMLDLRAGRACKATWLRFLRDHGDRLQTGKRSSLTDPSLPLKEMFPKFTFSPPRASRRIPADAERRD